MGGADNNEFMKSILLLLPPDATMNVRNKPEIAMFVYVHRRTGHALNGFSSNVFVCLTEPRSLPVALPMILPRGAIRMI